MGLSPEQAEEVAQEAFIVLLQKLDRIEPNKELCFLLSVAANLSQNVRRKSEFRCELSRSTEQLDNHAAETNTHGLVETKQARELVDTLLSRLSDPLRAVFVLYELEQLTLKEISLVLKLPLGTVGSRLRLARKAFNRELERSKEYGCVPLEEP